MKIKQITNLQLAGVLSVFVNFFRLAALHRFLSTENHKEAY